MDLLSHLPSYSPLLHAPSSSPSPKSRVRVSQNLLPIRRKPSQYSPISSQNRRRMEPPTTVHCSCQAGDNGYPKGCRIGEVARVTKETDVQVRLNLDGTGIADSSTGIPFLAHMLDVSSENYESVVNINN